MASRIAAITGDYVPVVAALCSFLDVVSAGGLVACVAWSRASTSPAILPLASRAAAIARGGCAVIALLGTSHYPVAALDDARCPRVGTGKANLNLRAISGTTVTTRGVAVVTHF